MPWIERVRTEQPLHAGVGIDWSNKFGAALVTGVLGNLGVGISATGRLTTISAGASNDGNLLSFSGTGGNKVDIGPVVLSGPMSIASLSRKTTGHSFNTVIFDTKGLTDWSNPPGFAFVIRSDGGVLLYIGTAETYTTTALFQDAKFHTASAIFKPGVSQDFYIDGVKPTYTANAVASGYTNTTTPLKLGTYYDLTGGRSGAQKIAYAFLFSVAFTPAEMQDFHANPWQLFEKERIWVPVAAGGPVTHATTGALTGQLGSVAGTAAHVAVHWASGTPTGQLGSVAGSAARLRAFSSTGALTGQGASIVGSAARAGGTTTHDATGTPTGQGSAVVGTAAHVAIHGTSGTLVGTSALLAGTAVHNIPHGTSGDLTGPGSVVVGSALNGLASVTKSGVNRLWLIDYYTKEFAAKEKLRNPEPAKTKMVAKKRAAEVAAKVEASVAKAEKDLVTLTKSMKDVQDAQVFIYNAIQQAQQAPQAEPVDFMAVAKRYEKKVQQEEHELLLLAMVL